MKIFSIAIIFVLGFMTEAKAQFRTKSRDDKSEWMDFKKFGYGFYLAGNHFDYKLDLDPQYGVATNGASLVASKPSYSFGAGLIGKVRLGKHLDLRLEPGMHFVHRDLTFKAAEVLLVNPQDRASFTERKVKSTYVDVPLLLEFHGDRWYNSRPYVAGGVNWMMNLQSLENSSEDNMQGTFRTTTHNFAWSAEVGIQFYFSKFKLTPAFRGTFGLTNEVVADNPSSPKYWAGALSGMNTRAFMFVLKFE